MQKHSKQTQFNIFTEHENQNYRFQGYAYEDAFGNIRLELHSLPSSFSFSQKITLIKEEALFKTA